MIRMGSSCSILLTCIQNRKADWVIFHEIMQTGEKTYIRDVTKIEKSYLLEYAPEYYKLR
jgi:ATP-dependent RNA helicase DDX35